MLKHSRIRPCLEWVQLACRRMQNHTHSTSLAAPKVVSPWSGVTPSSSHLAVKFSPGGKRSNDRVASERSPKVGCLLLTRTQSMAGAAHSLGEISQSSHMLGTREGLFHPLPATLLRRSLRARWKYSLACDALRKVATLTTKRWSKCTGCPTVHTAPRIQNAQPAQLETLCGP